MLCVFQRQVPYHQLYAHSSQRVVRFALVQLQQRLTALLRLCCDAAGSYLGRPTNTGSTTNATAPTSTIRGARSSIFSAPAATTAATGQGANGTNDGIGFGFGAAGLGGLFAGMLVHNQALADHVLDACLI